MRKCEVCKQSEAEWAWQPFGPDENPRTFTTLGSHYRGFPVLAICNHCEYKISNKFEHDTHFTYKSRCYVLYSWLDTITSVPTSVICQSGRR